jgi:hypothetical protein
MIAIIGKAAAVVAAFFVLWLMRSTTPSYDELTGPIPFGAAADNIAVDAGKPLLAKTIRFKATNKPIERSTDGVWLIIPIRVRAAQESARLLGAAWQAQDGKRYASSLRVEDADVSLPGKGIQPGLERKSLLVFEVPEEAARSGTLLLSEAAFPRLTAQLHIAYPELPFVVPSLSLDLDKIHGEY